MKPAKWMALIVFAALFSLSVPAELKHKPWIEKDWTKWTDWDCDNTLRYSPWVYHNEGQGRETGPMVQMDHPDMYEDVQLLSALPVRQAKLRSLQVHQHYDRMNAQKRQAFDQQHAGDVAETDDDPVRIQIIHNNFARDNNDPANFVSLLPPTRISLKLADGTLVMPSETTVYQRSTAEYVFPRKWNGKPLYTPNDQYLVIVWGQIVPLDKKNVVQLAPQKPAEFSADPAGVTYKFKISEMIYKGKLEY